MIYILNVLCFVLQTFYNMANIFIQYVKVISEAVAEKPHNGEITA